MKFGVADYGMNVWYGGLFSIEDRLEALKSIGFDGIERIEAVDASDALNRATLYHKHGMDFATCRGPNIQSGIEWTCGLGKDYVWLGMDGNRQIDMKDYIRRANEFARVCGKFKIKAALHNHMCQLVENQGELEYFMEACPDVGLLLDTGHLDAGGGDVAKMACKYIDRIVAIHLKDVKLPAGRDENGRAKEWTFCELGSGNSGLDNGKIMRELIERGYDGWVFIEHDSHERDPLIDLKTSLDYLKDAGIVRS